MSILCIYKCACTFIHAYALITCVHALHVSSVPRLFSVFNSLLYRWNKVTFLSYMYMHMYIVEFCCV